MNIFIRELKANFKSLLIWSGIVILFTLVSFSKFTAYYDNPELLAVLDAMPKAFLDAFSMNAFNLSTLTGFFGVMTTFYGLILCIAAVMWGSDIIVKEERDKTVEFALTLPVPRSRMVTAKIFVVLINCIILLGVAWGSTMVNAMAYKPEENLSAFMALTMLSIFIMQMIFLAIGIFLGCALKRYKQAGSISVSILLATYILSTLSGMSKDLEFLKYFTPFKYFDPVEILNKLSIDVNYVLLSAGIIGLCLAGAYLIYSRRDLYI